MLNLTNSENLSKSSPEEIPFDIIKNILSFLPRKDVSFAWLTLSKSFYKAAGPILYQKIILRPPLRTFRDIFSQPSQLLPRRDIQQDGGFLSSTKLLVIKPGFMLQKETVSSIRNMVNLETIRIYPRHSAGQGRVYRFIAPLKITNRCRHLVLHISFSYLFFEDLSSVIPDNVEKITLVLTDWGSRCPSSPQYVTAPILRCSMTGPRPSLKRLDVIYHSSSPGSQIHSMCYPGCDDPTHPSFRTPIHHLIYSFASSMRYAEPGCQINVVNMTALHGIPLEWIGKDDHETQGNIEHEFERCLREIWTARGLSEKTEEELGRFRFSTMTDYIHREKWEEVFEGGEISDWLDFVK